MWPEGGLYSGPIYREPTRAELEAQIAEVRESYREDMREASKRHAQNVARIRQHRDSMLAIVRKRLDAATV